MVSLLMGSEMEIAGFFPYYIFVGIMQENAGPSADKID